MSAADYIEGWAFLIATAAPVAYAALLLVRRRHGQLRGAARALAIALWMTIAWLGVHVVPLLFGVLTRGTAVGAAVLLAVCVRLLLADVGPRDPEPAPEAPRAGPLSWLLAGGGALAVATTWLGYVQQHAAEPQRSIDALTFHLSGATRFVQSGSLWVKAQFVPDQAHTYYPHFGDLTQATLMLPWHSDWAARWAMFPFLVLAAFAVAAVVRELRAPWPTAILVGTAFGAIPAVFLPALEGGLVDALMLFGFAAALLFLVRALRTGRRDELVLAGIGLGLAVGTKWYGPPIAAVTIAVWAGGLLLVRRQWRDVARDGAVLIGVTGLAGGIWLARNWILTGNPVFPAPIEPLGLTIFDAPPDVLRELGGWTIAHYATDRDVLSDYIFPAWRATWQLPGLLALGGGGLTAALLLARRRRLPGGRIAAALLVLAALAAAVYVTLPYGALGAEGAPRETRANTRYGVPALLIGIVLLGWAAGRLPRWRPLIEVGLLVATAQGLASRLDVPVREHLLGLLALVAAWLFVSLARRGRRPALAAAAAALVAVVAYGDRKQSPFFDDRYRSQSDAVVVRVLDTTPADARIGLTSRWTTKGIAPVQPLFGPRLRRSVEYVGPYVRHMRREYTDRASFDAALRRGRYDALVVGTGDATPNRPPYEDWLRDGGWREELRTDRLELWRPEPR